MKLRLAFASLLVLSACGTSQEALQALQTMQFIENNPSDGISYASLNGSGGNVTLKDVTFKSAAAAQFLAADESEEGAALAPAPAAPTAAEPVARAETVTFTGLTMKDGKPLFTGMVINGLTPAGAGVDELVTMRIGSVGFEGLNPATGAFLAQAMTKEGPGAAPAFKDWGFAKASLNGLTVKGAIPQEEGTPGDVSVELGEISISNLKDALVGLTRFSGLKGAFSVPGEMPVAGTFDFGTFDLKNLRGGLYADAFEAGMASMTPGATAPDYAKMFAGYTSPLEYGFDGATWTGMKVDVSGVRLDASPASFTATRNADGVVVATSSPRATWKLTADASGGAMGAMGLMVMAMAGYPSNTIELYGSGEATFDPSKDLTRYTAYNVGVTDVFDVKVEGGVLGLQKALPTLLTGLMSSMESIGPMMADDEEDAAEGEDVATDEEKAEGEDDADDADDASPIPQEMMATMVMGLISLQLTDLDISITDKQLLGFIMNGQALSSGQSVTAYRQDLVNMVNGSAVFMTDAGIDPAIANEATAAIAGFLGGPGTLRIQIKPKTPFGLMTAMMAPPTKESLGFSATFTPAAAQ